MQTDYVDAVLLHRIDTLFELNEVAEAFDALESSGKVRHFGVSNMGPWQIELLQSGLRQKLEINQLQFGLMHTQMLDAEIQFNMASDPAADRTGGILPYSRLKHMTIQAWCPFQSGTEYGPFVGNEHFPELNAELTRLAGKYGSTPNGIAVAWILRHPAGIQPLLGSMTPERIRQMAAGADIELDAVTGGRCIRQPAIRWCEREMTRPLPLRRVFSVHTSQRQSMLCQSTHDENNDTNIPRITSERWHIERGN